jgi:nanoRNase/pAp phosphatase (c-di-AMP/oligoRNAs hydrolase)
MMQAMKTQSEQNKTYKLITRSDMDGLVCGILLKELGLIHEIMFAHPKDMQDGKIPVTSDDITTNLPYVPGAYLSFDHHASEVERIGSRLENHIIDEHAESAARVVYDYFGGRANPRFAAIGDDMMAAVDKADAAKFTREEILDPSGWTLLSFIMDARTGLGRFRDFSISNYELMMKLIDAIRGSKSIEDVLALPDVNERIDLYKQQQMKFRQQIERCSTVHKNLVVIDLRNETQIWAGNRFVIYALFPQCNISMHVMHGRGNQNTVFAVGKSILNRTSNTNIGQLMLENGGGGHEAAGTCQVENDIAEDVKKTLIAKIIKDR